MAYYNLTGLFPMGLGLGKKVNHFDLSGNTLVGAVPKDICNYLGATRVLDRCYLELICCFENGQSILCIACQHIFSVKFL